MATIAKSSTCSKDDNFSGSNNTNISVFHVPATVISAFNSRYPAASGQIEWEKEDGNTYKVKFFIVTQRWGAIFAGRDAFISEMKI